MDEDYRLWGNSSDEQISRINKALEEFEPNLVFSEGFAGLDIKKVYPEIRKRKIPIFYWAIEDPITPHLAEAHLPYVDTIFTTTIERVSYYKSKGKYSKLLLFACNPEFHKTVPSEKKYECDIVLVASNYSNRYDKAEWFIKPLIETGYDIHIWGIWWDDPNRPICLKDNPIYKGVLPYEELAKAYCSAKIILGMNCDDTSVTQTSMRPYEALACGGGVFLAHYTQAQENIFGNHIFQAKNAEETKNLVDYLLSLSPEERKEHAKKAQKFVYENHTYQKRVLQIIDTYNVLYKGV